MIYLITTGPVSPEASRGGQVNTMLKLNEKGMSSWATVLVVAVIIVVLVLVFSGGDDTNTNEEAADNTEQTEEVEGMEEGSVLEILLGDEDTQAAALLAVDESESSGTAYRLYDDGTLYHGVIATLADPARGNAYEGWLVQTAPLAFISTGVLTEQEDNVWTLEFSSNQEYPTYLRVVITEEEVVDPNPERHVIEGDFE